MSDRMQLMERLLKHHLPTIDLETESLRQACDALSVPSPDLTDTRSSPGIGPSEPLSSNSVASLGIEDEGCTIDNVNGAITRRFDPARLSKMLTSKGLTQLHPHVDYSGEFSHWNFSMHVKRSVDNLMAQSNLPVCFISIHRS